MRDSALSALVFVGCFALLAGSAAAVPYPPDVPSVKNEPFQADGVVGDLLFTNTHNYVSGFGDVTIKVEVFNNFLGDFTKYHWKYTVTNIDYDPVPGVSNGFSGFETVLPANVPDIGDIYAPDGIPPWIINTFSGAPVEWDLPNSDGLPVGGGTLPGETEVYGFSTLPRLVVLSSGWFHTWTDDIQDFVYNYPDGDGVEVPDVINDPGQELCCWEPEPGVFACEVLPAGECDFIGGFVVPNCDDCPPATPTERESWSGIKGLYRE